MLVRIEMNDYDWGEDAIADAPRDDKRAIRFPLVRRAVIE
jgi:hypothetical protein